MGCPYHCCYCTYPVLEGPHYRPREPEAVIADMERLWQDQGVDTVFFTDSVFNDVQGTLLESSRGFGAARPADALGRLSVAAWP